MDSFYSDIIDKKTGKEKQYHGVPKNWVWELRPFFLLLLLMHCIVIPTFKFSSPEAGRVYIVHPLSKAKSRETDKMSG